MSETPERPAQSRTKQGRYIRANPEIEHDALCAELRGQGLTYAAIGKRVGVTKAKAWEAVQRAFRDTLTEPAETARAVELARLEDMHDRALAVLEAQEPSSPGAILGAIDRIVKVSESRRKLLGLDAPQRHELTLGEIDAALSQVDDDLAAARREAAEAGGAEGEEG